MLTVMAQIGAAELIFVFYMIIKQINIKILTLAKNYLMS